MTEIFRSPWIPCAVLFGLALGARLLQGSWLAPSAFPALLWSAYIALPLLTLNDVVSPFTVWIIVALILSTQLGAFVSEYPTVWRGSGALTGVPLFGMFASRALHLVLVFSAIALVGSALFVRTAFNMTDVAFSWEGFWGLGTMMYGFAIAGEAQPWWLRLTRVWVFPAVILGGMSFATASSTSKKAISLLGFVPVLLIGSTLASRFGTAMAITCWVGSYLGMKTYRSKGNVRFPKTLLLAGGGVSVTALIMYVALGIVRGHELESSQTVYSYLTGNIFGYLSVFDHFVKSWHGYHHTFGFSSLGGALELLGLGPRETALGYQEVALEDGVTTNIYTAFRGLIEDFSYPGAVLLLAVGGFFAGRAYTNSCRGEISHVPVLVGYYCFFLWSPIISVFYYNSSILGLLVAWLFIRQQRVKLHGTAA